MEWLSLLLAAVLFAAACNLDTVILSMGYAVKGVRVSLSHSLIIAALTTLITWASLLLGGRGRPVLSGRCPTCWAGWCWWASGRGSCWTGCAAWDPPGRRKGKTGPPPSGGASPWPPPWR